MWDELIDSIKICYIIFGLSAERLRSFLKLMRDGCTFSIALKINFPI